MRIVPSFSSVDGGGGMIWIALHYFPLASVAAPVLLLVLMCLLRCSSDRIVQGVGPVPKTVLKKLSMWSLLVIWEIVS
jgi:hypothetical protein